jgi:radical SAM family uncharacterized protein
MTTLRQRITDELLPRVTQPSQYIGAEINACCGDIDLAALAIALAFPDTYPIGISHLGSQLLYRDLNDLPGVACDRTYCVAPDAEAVMREYDIELFGWETRRALREFDVIGFSLAYEMCATNVLTMLDLAGIAIRSADRSEDDPIILAGDALADSPEPMAPFIDVFIAGDGEEPMRQLATLLIDLKGDNTSRQATLEAIARDIPGAYVPSLYESAVDAAGRFAGLKPISDAAPAEIPHVHLPQLSDSPIITAPLVPLCEGVHERVIVEVMRGCPNACRFCQAGAVRLPVRHRPMEEIIDGVRQALAATGYREVSLLSLSTSDYPWLGELIDRLNAELAPQHVSISLPSLRVDSQLTELPKLTSAVRKGGLTIAAEAGSERLRKAIRKGITEADMIAGVQAAYEAGWHKVKVYFMAGLPGETPEDIDEMFALCKRLSDAGKAITGQPGSIQASVSWAVPKPHTPMQWSPMQTQEYFWAVRTRLRELCQRSAVSFKFHRIERSYLEGLLCRGDRRLADVIEAAWRNGARLDAWDEHFHYENWEGALAECDVDVASLHEPVEIGQPLPWDHIRCRRDGEFLENEYREMQSILADE